MLWDMKITSGYVHLRSAEDFTCYAGKSRGASDRKHGHLCGRYIRMWRQVHMRGVCVTGSEDDCKDWRSVWRGEEVGEYKGVWVAVAGNWSTQSSQNKVYLHGTGTWALSTWRPFFYVANAAWQSKKSRSAEKEKVSYCLVHEVWRVWHCYS